MTRTTAVCAVLLLPIAVCAVLVLLYFSAGVSGLETKADKPDLAAPGTPTLTPPLDAPATKSLVPELNPPELNAAAGLPPGPLAGIARTDRYVASSNVVITWSKANDVVWGFSKSVGTWAKREMNPPASGAPAVGENVAVWQVGSRIYAFSGTTSRWDVLQLPAESNAEFYIENDYALVNDGDQIHTFASSTGRWSSPTGKEAAVENPPGAAEIKVFTLRHARAADVERIVTQFYGREGVSAAVDERTNSLIVRGPAELNDIVQALLTHLDEQLEPTSKPPTAGPASSASVASQKAAYESAEQKADSLAQQLRVAKDLQPVEKSKLSTDLRRAVAQSFAARQRLHEAELAQLSQRMRGIEQTIQARQRIADQIIDRRVKDLLDPNLQWDAPEARDSVAGTGPQVDPLAPRVDSPAGSATTTAPTFETIPRGASVVASRGHDEIFWNVLGVRVQAVAPQSLSKTAFKGGLLIDEIRPGRSAAELRAGDIIVGLHHWETKNIGDLLWTLLQPISRNVSITQPRSRSTEEAAILHYLRDGQPHTTRVVLPPWPPTSTDRYGATSPLDRDGAATSPSSRPPADLTAARAFRDKLRQQWEALEALFKGGKSRLEDILQAASDLGPAEDAAAATTDERRTALQEHVERVKRIKKIVEDKYNAQVEPIQNFLAAEAALIKAEAQLAEVNHAGGGVPSSAIDGSPTTSLPTGASGQSMILRTPDQFRDSFKVLESMNARSKQAIETGRFSNRELDAESLQTFKQGYERNQNELAFVREQYAAQIRLLELEMLDAESAVQSAEQKLAGKKRMFETNRSTYTDVVEAQRAYEAASVRVEKAKTLLDLYRKADPKPAAAEPPAKSDPPAQRT